MRVDDDFIDNRDLDKEMDKASSLTPGGNAHTNEALLAYSKAMTATLKRHFNSDIIQASVRPYRLYWTEYLCCDFSSGDKHFPFIIRAGGYQFFDDNSATTFDMSEALHLATLIIKETGAQVDLWS